ncbi:hypothetical protein lerEdw1_003493 [Lerista edwardsae]|nr:hypothetical protein lerEdw1_003493 [Lerista edwardsae]
MAAEVDFGDRELFQQLDSDEPATAPAAQPLHARFEWEDDDDDDDEDEEGGGGGGGGAERAEETEKLRERLRECEETVRQLQAENILPPLPGPALPQSPRPGPGSLTNNKHCELRRKLNILTRPRGLEVEDSKLDGPLLQILFMNSTISKQYHQEIEDFISSLAERYEEQQRADHDKTYFNIKPQVVGSVLYFTNFCLDKLGQPILNENPQLTDGWEIPKYPI